LEHFYSKAWKQLEDYVAMGSLSPDTEVCRISFAEMSIAYLTYGHLEAIPQLLEAVPFLPVNMRRFVFHVIYGLLPIPRNSSSKAAEQLPIWVKHWLEENRTHLKWNKEEGKFDWI